jgi:hypothetical protein
MKGGEKMNYIIYIVEDYLSLMNDEIESVESLTLDELISDLCLYIELGDKF